MRALTPSPKARVLLGIALAAALAVAGWYVLRAWGQPDAARVTVTTDRTSYRPGDTVYLTIRNRGWRQVEVYVGDICAIGGFAALVQVRSENGWSVGSIYAAYAGSPLGSIDISRGPGAHALLAPGSSLEMRLPDIRPYTAHPGAETMRAAFYVGSRPQLVYSNEFTVAP